MRCDLSADLISLQLGKGGRVVKVTGIEQRGRTATVSVGMHCVVLDCKAVVPLP